MTIIYTVIARTKDATILVEVADSDIKGGNLSQMFVRMMEYFRDNPDEFGDEEMRTYIQRNGCSEDDPYDFLSYFVEACTTVLSSEEEQESRQEYEPEEYFIHVYRHGNVFYTCLSDDRDPRDQKVSFAYLTTLQKDFVKFFRAGRINNARAYGLDKDFTPVVRSIAHYHNINRNSMRTDQRVQLLKTRIEDMKSILQYNLHLMIQRSHDIDGLVSKSDQLSSQVQVFKKNTRKNLNIQKRRYYSKSLLLCLLVLIGIYIGIAIPCGLTLSRCQITVNSNSNNSNSNYYTNYNSTTNNGNRWFMRRS